MKRDHIVVAGLVALASEIALAQTRVGTVVPWDGTGFLAIAAGGLALGIWLVRRNKDK